MPKFVAAQYVANDLPPPETLIRAVDDEGTIWWLQEDCTQGDWLEFKETGGEVLAAKEEEGEPYGKLRKK